LDTLYAHSYCNFSLLSMYPVQAIVVWTGDVVVPPDLWKVKDKLVTPRKHCTGTVLRWGRIAPQT